MPVVVEVILERITNVSMGQWIAAATEFEEASEPSEPSSAAVYATRD